MQIILNQNELEDAIRDTVLKQIAIREDQKILISMEETDSGEMIAVINVGKAETTETVEVIEPAKPKTRARKETTEPVVVVNNVVNQTKTEPNQETATVTETATETTETAEVAVEKGPSDENKRPALFGSTDNSVADPAASNGAAVTNAKSLFANLGKTA